MRSGIPLGTDWLPKLGGLLFIIPPKLTSELGGCGALKDSQGRSRRLGFLALSTRELGGWGGLCRLGGVQNQESDCKKTTFQMSS